MEPLVTVLLPVYNGGQYLKIAIDSVLNQSYKNIDLLIIEDGSTDDTVQIILSYKDPRIRLIRNQRNLGILATLNIGVKNAIGEFTARMDADDICKEERIRKQVDYLTAHPDVTMVDTIMELIDGNGNLLNRYNSNVTTDDGIRKTMKKFNCLGHSSIMIRTDDLKRYEYRKVFYEDDDLWLRLLNDNKKIHKIAEPLLLYRVHDQSIIKKDQNNNTNLVKFLITRWHYYRHLSFADKFKPFNLNVLFWIVIMEGVLQYKKIKQK